MRKFFLTIVALVAAGSVVVAVGAAAPSFRGIEPVVVKGSPKCSDLVGLNFRHEIKFAEPVHGLVSGPIHLFVEANGVGFFVANQEDVEAVIVKGGPNANVYRYPGGDLSDGLLMTPTNPKNGAPYGLGYVTFCYNPPA
jgi:hypothetical protein